MELIDVLAKITTNDEHGIHFTSSPKFKGWEELERCGYIKIDRPVHKPTGIPYSQEEWTVEIQESGIEALEKELI